MMTEFSLLGELSL